MIDNNVAQRQSGSEVSEEAQDPTELVSLTPRQIQCLTRIAAGESSAQIALALGLSKRTVDEHVRDACAKLGVRKRSQAVAKTISLGIIPPVASF